MEAAHLLAVNSADHGWSTCKVAAIGEAVVACHDSATPDARLTCPWARADAEGGQTLAGDVHCAASSTGTREGTLTDTSQGGTPEGCSADHGEAQQVPVLPTVVRAPMAKYDVEPPISVTEWQGLPSDFRLHLQLFEKVSKQAQLLDQLSQQQESALTRLQDIQQQMLALTQDDTRQTSTASQVAGMRKELRKLQESQAKLTEAMQITSDKSDARHEQYTELLGATLLPIDAREVGSEAEEPAFIVLGSTPPGSPRGLPGKCPVSEAIGVCPLNSGDESPSKSMNLDKDVSWSLRTKYYFKFGFGNRLLEAICATVIVINALSMGVKVEMTAKAEILGEDSSPEMWAFMRGLERFFVSFYTAEYLFKCWLFQRDMLAGPDWKWNWFDLLLLLLAYFEDFSAMVQLEQTGVDVTWMRLLRLLKMLKMLRVVRVMRFFKELRTVLNSLIGSVAALMWSLVMIFLVTYIFGLIFLQAVASYIELMQGAENLDDETSDNIKAYWNGVVQAVVTLYMAITGGSDWEPLAQPFKVMPDSGQLYYIIFLLYIAFAMIAVLNVVTGMFVDAAMKVAVADENHVFEEIMEKYKVQIKAFTEFLQQNDDDGSGNVHWPSLRRNLHAKEVKEFLKALEMEAVDLHRIHKNLSNDGGVPIEDFIDACSKCRGDTRDMDMLGMHADFKRYAHQMGHMMEYTEERFNEVYLMFMKMGAPTSQVRPLSQRLAASRTLPPTWSSHHPKAKHSGARHRQDIQHKQSHLRRSRSGSLTSG